MGAKQGKTVYIVVDTGRKYPQGTIIWGNGFRTEPRGDKFYIVNDGGVNKELPAGSPYIATPAQIPGWQPYTGA
jgi:hypothetical protein